MLGWRVESGELRVESFFRADVIRANVLTKGGASLRLRSGSGLGSGSASEEIEKALSEWARLFLL